MRVHALRLQQSFVLLSPYKIVGEPNTFHLYSETRVTPVLSYTGQSSIELARTKGCGCVKHRFYLQYHLVSEAQVLQVLKHCFA